MFSSELLEQAAAALDLAKAKDIRIATAETCTAGTRVELPDLGPGRVEDFRTRIRAVPR